MHYCDTVAFKQTFDVLCQYDPSRKIELKTKIDALPQNALTDMLRAQLCLLLASDSSCIHPADGLRLVSIQSITECLRHSASTQERDPATVTMVHPASVEAVEAMAHIENASLSADFPRLGRDKLAEMLHQPQYIGLIGLEAPNKTDNAFLAHLIGIGIPGRTNEQNYQEAVRVQPSVIPASFAVVHVEAPEAKSEQGIANIVTMAELPHHPDAGIAVALRLLKQVPRPYTQLHDGMSERKGFRKENTVASIIDLHRRQIA